MLKQLSSALKTAYVVAGGYRAAVKIGAFKEPNREILPRYIQVFCTKLAHACHIDIIPVNTIPQHHALWVGNHISWIDVATYGALSPAFFLSRHDVAEWPVLGKLATAAGTLFIKRGSGDSGRIKDQIADFLREGISVLFFPEATTTDGRNIKKLHGKLLQAAIDANVPVQGMVVCYVNADGKLDSKVPFIGDVGFTEHLIGMLGSKKVTAYVKALEPIHPNNFADKEALTAELQARMEKALSELQAQVLKNP